MAKIFVDQFHGIAPRLEKRKLAHNQAQIARNVDIFSRELKPLRTNLQVFTPTKTGTIESIFLLGDLWLHWAADVDVMRSPLFVENSRIHYSGDYNPKSTDATLAEASPGTDYPTDFYRLGIPRPDTAPTVGHTGGTGNAITRVYVYTFVSAWGEEGPPSAAGTHTGVDDATQWDISTLDATPPNSGTISAATPGATTVTLDFSASHFLETGEYITIAGTIVGTGAIVTDLIGTFQVTRTDTNSVTIVLTTSGTYTSGATWAREAPLQTTGWAKRVYRSLGLSYRFVGEVTGTTLTDTVTDANLGEELPGGILEEDWWKAPNGDLKGLIVAANGVTAGFFDNVLCLTPAYVPSAWPDAYQVTFEYAVVALAVLGNTIVVLTESSPYLVPVDDPAAAAANSTKLEFFQPCIAKKSAKSLQNGVLYVCPDGVAYVPSAGFPTLITKALAKKKDWESFNPTSMIGAVYDDRYYLFYSNGGEGGNENGGLIFDSQEPDATFTELTGLVTATHSVVETDTLYLMDDEQGTISRFDSGGDFQVYQWLSKMFSLPYPTCLKAAKVKLELENALSAEDQAAAIAAAVAAVEAQLETTQTSSNFYGDLYNEIIADAPVAWYRHESGALEIDSSGNGNHATTTTAVDEIAGEIGVGGAGDYNGTTSLQLVAPDATIDNLGYVSVNQAKQFTMEFMVYIDALPVANQIVLSKDYAWEDSGPDGSGGWEVAIQTDGKVRFAAPNTAAATLRVISSTALSTDEWHHIIIIGQGGTNSGECAFYIDGVLEEQNSGMAEPSIGGIGIYVDSANELRLGCGTDNPTGAENRFFDGRLDEVALYDYRVTSGRTLRHAIAVGLPYPHAYLEDVLADSPVAYYPHEGDSVNGIVGDDYSVNNNTATPSTTLNSAAGTIRDAANYTAGPYQTAPNIAGVNQDLASGSSVFTVEVLVNPTNLGSTRAIASKGRVANEGWDLNVQTNGAVRMNIHYSVLGGSFETPAAAVTTGAWYHVVIVAQGDSTSVSGIRKAYVNGSAVTVTHVADPSGVLGSDSAYPLRIGARLNAAGSNEQLMHGLIDDLSIFDRELTSGEVAARFALTGL